MLIERVPTCLRTAAAPMVRRLMAISLTAGMMSLIGCGTRTPEVGGTWFVFAGEKSGEQLEPDHRYMGRAFTIGDGQIFIDQGEAGIQAVLKIIATDWDKSPAEMRLFDESNQSMIVGLIELDGETLSLCLPNQPGEEAPSGFTTVGTNNLTLRLRRDRE